MQKGGNLFCCTPFGTKRQYFLNYFIPQHSLGYTLMPMQGFVVGMQGFVVGMQGFVVGMQGFIIAYNCKCNKFNRIPYLCKDVTKGTERWSWLYSDF